MRTPGAPNFEEQLIAAGQRWAHASREQIHQTQRAAAGGWPGTMTEARFRVSQLVSGAPVRPKSAPTGPDRERMAHVLYASARAEWLLGRDKEVSYP